MKNSSRILYYFFLACLLSAFAGCSTKANDCCENLLPLMESDSNTYSKVAEPTFSAAQIPVLCYHHIKSITSNSSSAYTISPAVFEKHIKMLFDQGYHTILPGQLYEYLTKGATLPSHPVMLTFDDTQTEHFSVAAPLLKKYGFKGVFFVMSVPINKKGYLTQKQIKELSAEGHVIGCHTWDHPDVRALHETDWEKQVDLPKYKLEQITGKPVLYFAYPNGLWNEAAIQELKKRGVKAAFQLAGKQSQENPLYTIRRLMVPGNWSALRLQQEMEKNFNAPYKTLPPIHAFVKRFIND